MGRLLTSVGAIGGGALALAGLGFSDPGGASTVPSVCVWVGIGTLGGPTSTAVIPADASTCPELPPSDASPCDDGIDDYTEITAASTVVLGAVYFCVKDLP